MKRTTSMTIAAIVVATIATASVAPAFAQEAAGRDPQTPRADMHQRGPGPHGFWLKHHDRGGPGGMRMVFRGSERGGLFSLVCSPRGADRLEHVLLTIAQKTDLTADQQPLYDTFRTTALTAQTGFADKCAEARPVRGAGAAERPDLADRLKLRLDIQKAHVDALGTVLPTFEAFYDSLTDAQKAQLEPRRHDRKRHLGVDRRHGPHRGAPNADQPKDG